MTILKITFWTIKQLVRLLSSINQAMIKQSMVSKLWWERLKVFLRPSYITLWIQTLLFKSNLTKKTLSLRMKINFAQELVTTTKSGRYKKLTRKLESKKRRFVSDAKSIAIIMLRKTKTSLKQCKFTLSMSSIYQWLIGKLPLTPVWLLAWIKKFIITLSNLLDGLFKLCLPMLTISNSLSSPEKICQTTLSIKS